MDVASQNSTLLPREHYYYCRSDPLIPVLLLLYVVTKRYSTQKVNESYFIHTNSSSSGCWKKRGALELVLQRQHPLLELP